MAVSGAVTYPMIGGAGSPRMTMAARPYASHEVEALYGATFIRYVPAGGSLMTTYSTLSRLDVDP